MSTTIAVLGVLIFVGSCLGQSARNVTACNGVAIQCTTLNLMCETGQVFLLKALYGYKPTSLNCSTDGFTRNCTDIARCCTSAGGVCFKPFTSTQFDSLHNSCFGVKSCSVTGQRSDGGCTNGTRHTFSSLSSYTLVEYTCLNVSAISNFSSPNTTVGRAVAIVYRREPSGNSKTTWFCHVNSTSGNLETDVMLFIRRTRNKNRCSSIGFDVDTLLPSETANVSYNFTQRSTPFDVVLQLGNNDPDTAYVVARAVSDAELSVTCGQTQPSSGDATSTPAAAVTSVTPGSTSSPPGVETSSPQTPGGASSTPGQGTRPPGSSGTSSQGTGPPDSSSTHGQDTEPSDSSTTLHAPGGASSTPGQDTGPQVYSTTTGQGTGLQVSSTTTGQGTGPPDSSTTPLQVGDNSGAIAGGIIAGVIVLAGAALVTYCYFRRHKQKAFDEILSRSKGSNSSRLALNSLQEGGGDGPLPPATKEDYAEIECSEQQQQRQQASPAYFQVEPGTGPVPAAQASETDYNQLGKKQPSTQAKANPYGRLGEVGAGGEDTEYSYDHLARGSKSASDVIDSDYDTAALHMTSEGDYNVVDFHGGKQQVITGSDYDVAEVVMSDKGESDAVATKPSIRIVAGGDN